MSLVSFGLNHKTTPLAVRERLAFAPASQAGAIAQLLAFSPANEAVLLSTCNRTEIYADVGDPRVFCDWLKQQCCIEDIDLLDLCYCHYGDAAISHLLRVASGLDSMMLGEPQILGQLKQSYFSANQAGGVGRQFKQLFPWVFSTTKKIRHQTDIGKNPVSMAYAVVQLAKSIFADLAASRVMLIGAGDMMELMATYLKQQNINQIYVANRTLEKSATIAKQFSAQCLRIADVPAYLNQVDILISATSSQLPLIGKGMIESVMKARRHKPLLMVDLAVPRDIEPQVDELEDVYLFNIDDLQEVIANNLQSRAAAAKQAETMIAIQAQHYMQSLNVMDAGDVIKQFRSAVEDGRDQEVAEALRLLQQGREPSIVLTSLARSLSGRFLHPPTKALRAAAFDGRLDVLNLIKELYDIT